MEEFDSDDIDEANADEVRWVELLVQDNQLPENYFNTFEWLSECSKRLSSPLTTLPTSETLEISDDFDLKRRPFESPNVLYDDWRGIDGLKKLAHEYQKINEGGFSTNYEEFSNYLRTPVEVFLNFVRRGAYPPPELLLVLAKSFDLYFKAEGRLMLENVFFGPSVKRSGNYSARRSLRYKGASLDDFHDAVIREQEFSEATGKKFDINNLAEKFIDNAAWELESDSLTTDDIESFLRTYRRWVKKHFPET